jgi:hypothetical protein
MVAVSSSSPSSSLPPALLLGGAPPPHPRRLEAEELTVLVPGGGEISWAPSVGARGTLLASWCRREFQVVGAGGDAGSAVGVSPGGGRSQLTLTLRTLSGPAFVEDGERCVLVSHSGKVAVGTCVVAGVPAEQQAGARAGEGCGLA